MSEHPKELPSRENRVTKIDINELVTVVVDQLRLIDKDISAGTMLTVAQQIMAKYPSLDFADDDGFSDGKGYIAIKLKLIHRNSYLNRFKSSDAASSSRADTCKERNQKSGTLKEYWEMSNSECTSQINSILVRDEPDILTDDILSESQAYVRFFFS